MHMLYRYTQSISEALHQSRGFEQGTFVVGGEGAERPSLSLYNYPKLV